MRARSWPPGRWARAPLPARPGEHGEGDGVDRGHRRVWAGPSRSLRALRRADLRRRRASLDMSLERRRHASTPSMCQHETWHWTYGSIAPMLGRDDHTDPPRQPSDRPRRGCPDRRRRPASRLARRRRLLVAEPAAPAPPRPRTCSSAEQRTRLARRLPAATRSTSSPTERSRSSPSSGDPVRSTRIHDHMTWCVFGVIQGVDHEGSYDAELNVIGPQRQPCRRRQRLRATWRHPPRPQHGRHDRDLVSTSTAPT